MISKNLALTAIAIAAFSMAASPVKAEEAPKPAPVESPAHDGSPAEHVKGDKKAEKRAEYERRGKEMFEKSDTDKDGFLSKAEMEASQKARLDEMFERTDADKDGKLSPEELKKGREAMREKYRSKFKDKDHPKEDVKPDVKPTEQPAQ